MGTHSSTHLHHPSITLSPATTPQHQSESPCIPPLARLQVLKIGQTAADFAELSDEECASVSVLLNCGVGANAGKAKDIQVRCWLLGGDE